MKKNVDKNLENLKKRVPFTKDRQPSPEAKKKGWERRREAQRIMDTILELQNKPYGEIKKMKEEIKSDPNKHTLLEVMLTSYLTNTKFIPDFLDRHISKAPQEVDITSKGDKIDAGIFIVPPKDEGV